MDCFQNLILTFLYYQNCNVNLVGSTWPWKFYIFEGQNIINNYFVSQKALMHFYGYDLLENKIEDDDILSSITNALQKDCIIVNTDQYFIKHHYKDIYQKLHGEHSLILLNYNKTMNSFFGIGVMPEFKGYIEQQEIVDGIKSFPNDNRGHMSYYWLSRNEQYRVKSEKVIFFDFINELKEIKKNRKCNLEHNDMALKVEVMNLKELYYMFKTSFTSDEIAFKNWYGKISKDRWYWEIDRVGKCYLAYMNTGYVKKMYNSIQWNEIITLTSKINDDISIAFKHMYKYYLTGKEQLYINGLDILKNSIDLEKTLIDMVLNSF